MPDPITDGSLRAVPRTITVPFPSIQWQRTWLSSAVRRACGLGRHAPGVAVIGHGTADTVGAEETRHVARMAAEMLPGIPVETGFLEVIGPTISDALGRLSKRGCREVVAAPLLLFEAGHAKRDIPAAVRAAAASAGISVRQADPLGCHSAIVSLARRRRHEALTTLASIGTEETVLLVVGRGASDPLAMPQIQSFAAASCAPTAAGEPGFARVQLGFVAAARPTLLEAIASAVAPSASGRPIRRVIVQPHLLFRGHVEEQVTAAVTEARRQHAGVEWVQVMRLGADPLVAQALVDRAAAAAAQPLFGSV